MFVLNHKHNMKRPIFKYSNWCFSFHKKQKHSRVLTLAMPVALAIAAAISVTHMAMPAGARAVVAAATMAVATITTMAVVKTIATFANAYRRTAQINIYPCLSLLSVDGW